MRIVIEAGKERYWPAWRELWRYRYLAKLLIWRDFAIQYRQTVLGPLWFVIQPFLTAFAFLIVFHRIAEVPTDNIPPVLFYLSGILLWGYFARCLTAVATIIIQQRFLFEKVYFPRLLIPLADICGNFFAWFWQALAFAVLLGIYFIFSPNAFISKPSIWAILGIPLLLTHAAALGAGIGLCIAALSVQLRDILQALNFLLQAWLLITPVAYPVNQVPEGWRWLAVLNPLAPLVEAWRFFIFGQGTGFSGAYWYSAVMTLLVLIIGLPIYNRAARACVDVL